MREPSATRTWQRAGRATVLGPTISTLGALSIMASHAVAVRPVGTAVI